MKPTREKQQLKVAEQLFAAIMRLPKQNFTAQTLIDAAKNAKVWFLTIEEYTNEVPSNDNLAV